MNCEHCEATEPILKELEKEGYQIDRFNVETPKRVFENLIVR